MAENNPMMVEVAYALPDRQLIVQVELAEAATVEQAIRASGILDEFPAIDLEKDRVGIFSKPVKLDHGLRPGDRVEIYRPLIADPKEVRRQRAAQGKVMKKGAAAAGDNDTA